MFKKIEVSLENGCVFIESFKMAGVKEKDFKSVLIELRKWEVQTFGWEIETDCEELSVEDVELFESVR